MKTVITDKSALKAITPAALATFAKSQGWLKREAYGEYANVFAGEDRPEILVPNTDNIADYSSAVARLITIFSDFTHTAQTSLYRDLMASDHDVVRVRAIVKSDDGSIGLNDGLSLVTNSRQMLLAAACAVNSPQPVYRTGANKEAMDYLNGVRLGQTEHGSFVITMMAGIPPRVQSSLFEDESTSEPIERKVSIMLMQALTAAKSTTALANSGDDIVFSDDIVEQGVSANLCEALAKLVDSGERVEIGVSWAKTRPRDDSTGRIIFSEADADILREGARVLRERIPQKNFELKGYVHRLNRDEQEQTGKIFVKGFVDDKLVSVVTTLDENEYTKATVAHEKRQEIIVTGDLLRQGERWQMLNPRVEILPDEDD